MSSQAPVMDLEHLCRWVGREQTIPDPLVAFPSQALAAALDRDDGPSIGAQLPSARHWLYFLDTPAASATALDGHLKLGGFLPPVPLSRRMWASGRLDTMFPLVLGRPATRQSVIRSVEAKTGKTGGLVFVTLDHEYSQEGRVCIREEQNLVYRALPTARAPLPPGEAAPTNADFSRIFNPDPVLLFRYSALTYNAHRIHYDRSYAVEQEFYPALVVHGPLLATLLLDLLHDSLPGAQLQTFTFRALRPSFDTAMLKLNGRRRGDEVDLWSSDAEGVPTMTATARLA